LLALQGKRSLFLVAEGEHQAYAKIFAKLEFASQILHSNKALGEILAGTTAESYHEILIDDSIGIISMINCRNLAEQRGLGERTVALMRSNFTKENMELLKRNG